MTTTIAPKSIETMTKTQVIEEYTGSVQTHRIVLGSV